MKQVVCDLLDQLAKKDSPPPAAAADPAEESVEKVASTAAGIEDFPSPFSLHSVSLQQELVRNSSSNALLQHEVEDNQTECQKGKNKKEKKDVEENSRRPLISKSMLCRLLAELVKSYAGCAKLILEYTFTPSVGELVTEEETALAFILDHLIPPGEGETSNEESTWARMLIATIAACSHSPDTQTVLASEVKSALSRVLAMVESTSKHSRIQVLMNVITSIIEACPGTASNQGTRAQQQQQHR